MSTGVLSQTLLGTYQIKDLVRAGCTSSGALVTPWLYTTEWDKVAKTGDLSAYEYKQAIESLRAVVVI
jgi:hypothetical protein